MAPAVARRAAGGAWRSDPTHDQSEAFCTLRATQWAGPSDQTDKQTKPFILETCTNCDEIKERNIRFYKHLTCTFILRTVFFTVPFPSGFPHHGEAAETRASHLLGPQAPGKTLDCSLQLLQLV